MGAKFRWSNAPNYLICERGMFWHSAALFLASMTMPARALKRGPTYDAPDGIAHTLKLLPTARI